MFLEQFSISGYPDFFHLRISGYPDIFQPIYLASALCSYYLKMSTVWKHAKKLDKDRGECNYCGKTYEKEKDGRMG